jgi:hypothetical protein
VSGASRDSILGYLGYKFTYRRHISPTPPAGHKCPKMGRKKIQIALLSTKRARAVTLKKRKPGLMKKAYELSVLCECDVFLYIRDKTTTSTDMFTSTDEDYVPDYTKVVPGDRKQPKDFEATQPTFSDGDYVPDDTNGKLGETYQSEDSEDSAAKQYLRETESQWKSSYQLGLRSQQEVSASPCFDPNLGHDYSDSIQSFPECSFPNTDRIWASIYRAMSDILIVHDTINAMRTSFLESSNPPG